MLSILNIVCQKGDIDIAKLLLENGAPVDVKNAADQTPLCFVKLLLTNRALTEVEDIKKAYSSAHCTSQKNERIVQMLCSHSKGHLTEDMYKRTPLSNSIVNHLKIRIHTLKHYRPLWYMSTFILQSTVCPIQ